MTNAMDFSRRPPTPRDRLGQFAREKVAIGAERELSRVARPLKPIEIVTRKRLDISFTYGMAPRVVTISLARVRGFFEEDGN